MMHIDVKEIRKVTFRIPRVYGDPEREVEEEKLESFRGEALKIGKGYYESAPGIGGYVSRETDDVYKDPCCELHIDVPIKDLSLSTLRDWCEKLATKIAIQLSQESSYFTIDSVRYLVSPRVGLVGASARMSRIIEPSPEVEEFMEKHRFETFPADGSMEIVSLPLYDDSGRLPGFSRDRVRMSEEPGEFTLEPELEKLAAQELDHRPESSALRMHWRTMKIGGNFLDHPELTIRLKRMPYYRFVGLERLLDKSIAEGETLRNHLGASIMDVSESPFGHITTASIAVITSDNKLVLVKRSNEVDRYRGFWSASIEEVMSVEMDSIDPWKTVERGIHEELGESIKVDRAFLTGVTLEYDCLAITLAFVAFVRQDWQEIVSEFRRRISSGKSPVPDPREWIVADCVPFRTEEIAQLLVSREYEGSKRAFSRLPEMRPGKWHPTSRYRILRASFYVHGIGETLEALEGAR